MTAAHDDQVLSEIRALAAQVAALESKVALPRLVTPEELGAYLGVERDTVHTYVSRDGLPCVKLGPKLLRFDLADVRRWARERGRNLPPDEPKPRHLQAVKGKP